MKSQRATVFVVDDDESFLKAVTRLLTAGGYEVETFTSSTQFLRERAPSGRGCVVLDLNMPDLNGMELQQALNRSANPMPVIFLTGHGTIPGTVRAMRDGAVDFLTKPVRKEALFGSVNRALARDAAERERRAYVQALRERYDKLTPRECEVLAHVISGQLNKEVAGDLGTSERTIKAHRAAIMDKLQLQSLADLVRFSNELGLPPARQP